MLQFVIPGALNEGVLAETRARVGTYGDENAVGARALQKVVSCHLSMQPTTALVRFLFNSAHSCVANPDACAPQGVLAPFFGSFWLLQSERAGVSLSHASPRQLLSHPWRGRGRSPQNARE